MTFENPTIAALITEFEQIEQAVYFLNTVCPYTHDLMYRATDETWWKREGLKWTKAEPPNGWVKQSSQQPIQN